MLISDSKKFIYFHIYKSGGSSIRRELMKYANKSYVIMQLIHHLRFIINNDLSIPEIYKYHPSLHNIKLIMGSEKFNSYYKFCFVREPLDWHISQYYYAKNSIFNHTHKLVSKMEFEDYIKWQLENNVKLQSDMVYENNNLLVNDVLKFENINSEYKKFCEKFNMPCKLRHINSSKRENKIKLKEDTFIKFIETYNNDYKLFNYRYSDSEKYIDFI